MKKTDKNRVKKILDKLSADERNYIYSVIADDPLSQIYLKLFMFYFILLSTFLLWPFDLISSKKNDVRWIGEKNGIEFQKTGQVMSVSPAHKFYHKIINNRNLTIELSLETNDINQAGPARIFSYSINKELSNFMIGQSWDKLVIRLRTTKTSQYGTSPHLVINDIFNSKSFQHIVIVYNSTEQRVYINGELKARSDVLRGAFTNWDILGKLAVGNNTTGDRPWKGKLFYAAVYGDALTEKEIHNKFLLISRAVYSKFETASLKINHTQFTRFVPKRPLVEYLFDEKNGDTVHDSGLGLTPIKLFIPKYIRPTNKRFLNLSSDYFQTKSGFTDILINILIFIPLGFLINATLRTRYGQKPRIAIVTLLSGTFFSICCESLQYYSMTRNSSLVDVATNMAGIGLGIFLDVCYFHYFRFRAKHIQI